MTTKDKALELAKIARTLAAQAGDSYDASFEVAHHYTHLACSVYRNRFGKRPANSVIEHCLYKLALPAKYAA